MIHCLKNINFPTLIKLKGLLGGIHHCITVVCKRIFDGNFPFALPPTQHDLDEYFKTAGR